MNSVETEMRTGEIKIVAMRRRLRLVLTENARLLPITNSYIGHDEVEIDDPEAEWFVAGEKNCWIHMRYDEFEAAHRQ